jgi:glycosyltransferase involved in cell wall biosynthesis
MPEFSGNVLLLANYLPDEQESMQRFVQILHMGLRARGIAVQMIRPEPKLRKHGSVQQGLGKWLGYVDKFVLFPSRLKKRLSEFKRGDVLHICDHSNAIYTKYAARIPHLVTCHDLLAIRSAHGEFPENPTGVTGHVFQQMILKGINRARRVACVSKATRDDLARLSELDSTKITLIENGLNHPYGPLARDEAMRRIAAKLKNPPAHFILHVGGNQWYKNRAGVIGIYSNFLKLLPEGSDLILVGKPLTEAMRFEISSANIGDRVHALHNCDNEDLRALYSAAEAFLFPSLAEGFGWPILEAQACGCAVVTSARPPMNEVGGDAAVYIDPRDKPAAARTLRDLLWESGLEKAARKQKSLANASRFGADRMIDRYVEEYARLAAA